MLVYLCKASLTYRIVPQFAKKMMFQTHPPSTIHVKMPNLPKIDAYNFRYKMNVEF